MPNVYIIAGPNGAGKTTFAREFLPNHAHCKNFVNADLIAGGISPLDPDAAAFRAGRLMVEEIRSLASRFLDFGVESTLPGRAHLQLIREVKEAGYAVHIFFLWIPSPDLAIARVRHRVQSGGHDVPVSVVRRRFPRCIRNFVRLYAGCADSWKLFDNSGAEPALVASAEGSDVRIINGELYDHICKETK